MKKYYIIDYPFGNHGFFAHLNFLLGQLDYAYEIAKEVLIDSLCLSKCDSLLAGISGVTYGSIFFNGLEYTDVYYFDEI